jgi:hypothetical protein
MRRSICTLLRPCTHFSCAVQALGRQERRQKILSKCPSAIRMRRCRSRSPQSGGFSVRICRLRLRVLFAMALPALFAMAGCGGSTAASSNGYYSLAPGSAVIDTNCVGCNAANATGAAVEQITATLTGGGAAPVIWSLSGGDAVSGAGTIAADGKYSPPGYLTADIVHVTITAMLNAGPGAGSRASTTLTLTPGFLQPLTPENVALGSGGTVTVTGILAEAGGTTGINFAVSGTPTGSSGGQGAIGAANCVRDNSAYTSCTATYTAPSAVSSTGTTYIVATIGSSAIRQSVKVLLNTAGINSNPATHQTLASAPILLGRSGGNNNHFDAQGNKVADCCGGTLGALIQNNSGTQYVLSNNHVLARSDQASVGEMIVGPGLIDDNCEPYGKVTGAATAPVGVLTAWLPLNAATTNADAAIAQVNSGAVHLSGAIQELGARQGNGTLAAAPPGISSTGGRGENATLNLTVAKSGRTTGLTCASVTALNLDVEVDYYKDCGETEPYLSKTFTNQIGIEGNQFSDAGDSGALVVDTGNAEPVGLFFAGGVTASGVSIGVASPASSVLSALGAQQGTAYTFVGAADHPVSCLNYGAAAVSDAQARTLTSAQTAAARQALPQARMMVNPSLGILGTATGKSSDHSGEATIIFYLDQNAAASVPQTVNGVRTEVIPTTAQAVAAGTAPRSAVSSALPSLSSAALSQAIAAKQQVVRRLLKRNRAFFGVGVGQSLDNPREAALVIYVDRWQVPAALPATINGLRTRYVVMDRLHVTRSYLTGPVHQTGRCMSHSLASPSGTLDLLRVRNLSSLRLF